MICIIAYCLTDAERNFSHSKATEGFKSRPTWSNCLINDQGRRALSIQQVLVPPTPCYDEHQVSRINVGSADCIVLMPGIAGAPQSTHAASISRCELPQAVTCSIACAELSDARRIIRPSVRLSRAFIWLLHNCIINKWLYKVNKDIYDCIDRNEYFQFVDSNVYFLSWSNNQESMYDWFDQTMLNLNLSIPLWLSCGWTNVTRTWKTINKHYQSKFLDQSNGNAS